MQFVRPNCQLIRAKSCFSIEEIAGLRAYVIEAAVVILLRFCQNFKLIPKV